MVMIENGIGVRRAAEVDSTFKLSTRSVAETRSQEASLKGNGFNLQTGLIGLTSSTSSAVLYIKNSEQNDLVVDSVIVGIQNTGTIDSNPIFQILINPTAGTIISTATPGFKVNRRTGSQSANLPNTTVYKGVEGATFTDGDYFGDFFCSQPRSVFPIDAVISNGGSLGFTLDTNTSAGTTQIYLAINAHLEPVGMT